MSKSIFDRIGHATGDTQDGLQRSGMNYLVRRVQLQGDGGNGAQDVRGAFGLYTSNGTFLKNAVGDEYRVVQHAEQLQLMDRLVEQGKCKMRTVGALSDRTAFAWADLPIVTEVRAGDPVQWGLLMTSSHGATANHAYLMAERIRCTNAMPRLNRGQLAGLKVTLRHSGDVQSKLARVYGMLDAALAQVNVQADVWQRLAERKVTMAEARAIVAEWVEVEKATDAQKASKLHEVEKVLGYAARSPGNVGDSSLWELLNGITYFMDHAQARYAKSVQAAKRFAASSVDGVQAQKRERALELVLKAA
jgi:hypothetical protein